MTRKKFIKTVMAYGVSRNKAMYAAAAFQHFGVPYASITIEKVVETKTKNVKRHFCTVFIPAARCVLAQRQFLSERDAELKPDRFMPVFPSAQIRARLMKEMTIKEVQIKKKGKRHHDIREVPPVYIPKEWPSMPSNQWGGDIRFCR